MDAVGSSTMAVSFDGNDRYRAWNPEDLDGDGVKDGESLVGEQGKVYSEKEINQKLKPHGLMLVGGALQSVDGFTASSDNASVMTDPTGFPLPAPSGSVAAPVSLADKLNYMDAIAELGGAALMWMALSTMAHTSMREMTDAKDIKHALQKGKLEAKDAEIRAKENEIAAMQEAANEAFAVAVVVAVISAVGIAGGFGDYSSMAPAIGQVVQSGYKAQSLNDGAEAKANEEKIHAMAAQKEQDALQMGIDDAQSNYDEAKELFKLALKIMSEHVDRESQVVAAITR